MSKAFNIFGDIVANDGERWFESDIMPSMFVGWLAKQEGDIEVNINSNGGDVAGGLAIANAIRGYKKGEVTCNVLGVAASMASVIACAGRRLCMGKGAFLMVHNPWTITQGNAEDLRKDAETLDKMRDSIVAFYQLKNSKSVEEIKEMMDAETWISREAANDFGFDVFDYAGEFKAAASLSRRVFGNAPEAAAAFVKLGEKAETDGTPETNGTEAPVAEAPVVPEVPSSPAPAAENWEARFKGLSAKFNDLQRKSLEAAAAVEKEKNAIIEARDVEISTLKSQLETGAKDLADAKAKISELSACLEESKATLQKATDDLAQTRDSLKAAEDKAAELEKTRDLLTAGVLTPAPTAETYAEKMKSAKTPEEREKLRAAKRAGKIK